MMKIPVLRRIYVVVGRREIKPAGIAVAMLQRRIAHGCETRLNALMDCRNTTSARVEESWELRFTYR